MKSLATIAALFISGAAGAQTVSGMAFTFVTDFDYPKYGYILPGATNGNFGGAEFELGFAEFDLTGFSETSSSVLSFRYASGHHVSYESGYHTEPAFGVVNFSGYVGDNVASKSDYRAPVVGTIGGIDLAMATVGSTLNFDVTSLFNAAVARHDTAFGLSISMPGPGNYFGSAPTNEFVTFDNFVLTASAVPEPSGLAMTLVGLIALGATTRRRPRGQIAV